MITALTLALAEKMAYQSLLSVLQRFLVHKELLDIVAYARCGGKFRFRCL